MSDNSSVAVVLRPFIAGGLSSVLASICVHPIDITRTRFNVLSTTSEKTASGLGIVKGVFRDEGIRGFYSGMSAAILRQSVYGTLKVGCHDFMCDSLRERNDGHPIPFHQKVLSAMSSGIIACLCGSPFEVARIKMMRNNCFPMNQRQNYRNPFHTMYCIVKEEGVSTLWRGCTPMMLSSIAMNVGMLSVYDQAKEYLIPYTKNHFTCSMLASAISSFICSFSTLPFDMLKARMVNMKKDPDTKQYPYRNIIDCAIKTIKKGGIFSFWRGYPMYYARLAPYSIITLLTKDSINLVYTDAFIN